MMLSDPIRPSTWPNREPRRPRINEATLPDLARQVEGYQEGTTADGEMARRATPVALRHEATQEIRVAPSQSAGRRRLQTTSSGCARKGMVVSVDQTASKWKARFSLRTSRGGACLRPRWHSAYSWHGRGLGSGVQRGNSPWDARRKPYKCDPRKGKVSMLMAGVEHPVVTNGISFIRTLKNPD
jgi:hypothetical protein